MTTPVSGVAACRCHSPAADAHSGNQDAADKDSPEDQVNSVERTNRGLDGNDKSMLVNGGGMGMTNQCL